MTSYIGRFRESNVFPIVSDWIPGTIWNYYPQKSSNWQWRWLWRIYLDERRVSLLAMFRLDGSHCYSVYMLDWVFVEYVIMWLWVRAGSYDIGSVINGSGPSLRVRVRVQTELLPNWRSGSSLNPNCLLGYRFMVNSQPVRIGRVVRGSPSGSIYRFI